MHRHVKAQEKGLDEALLHDNLVKVSQHVVDARQIRHMHFESKRLGDIDDGDVNGVWSTKIGTFLSFVPSSYRAQH